MTDLEQPPTRDELERRMEAAWRDVTAVELAGNIPEAERAYQRYVDALDNYMHFLSSGHQNQQQERSE